MKKEKNLSSKRMPVIANFGDVSKVIQHDYKEEDVREAVLRLKKRSKEWMTEKEYPLFEFDCDEIFGELGGAE